MMAVRSLAVDTRRTTGIVGLAANDNAREEFISTCKEILAAAAEHLPADTSYRKSVEATTKYRLGVVEGTESWDEIEETIGGGQLEELLFAAQCELELIPQYAKDRLWEDPPPAQGLEELH
eukprot:g3686.t1